MVGRGITCLPFRISHDAFVHVVFINDYATCRKFLHKFTLNNVFERDETEFMVMHVPLSAPLHSFIIKPAFLRPQKAGMERVSH
jgi:hypothetical protein